MPIQDQAEQNVEHDRETEDRGGVHAQTKIFQKLVFDFLEIDRRRVSCRSPYGRRIQCQGCGAHFLAPSLLKSFSVSGIGIQFAEFLLLLRVLSCVKARKASSSPALVTSSPERLASRASSSRSTGSASTACISTASRSSFTSLTPAICRSLGRLRLVMQRIRLPPVFALISDGVPCAMISP